MKTHYFFISLMLCTTYTVYTMENRIEKVDIGSIFLLEAYLTQNETFASIVSENKNKEYCLVTLPIEVNDAIPYEEQSAQQIRGLLTADKKPYDKKIQHNQVYCTRSASDTPHHTIFKFSTTVKKEVLIQLQASWYMG